MGYYDAVKYDRAKQVRYDRRKPEQRSGSGGETSVSEEKTNEILLSKEERAAEKALAMEMDANDAVLPKFIKNENGTYNLEVESVTTYSRMFGGTKSLEFAEALVLGCGDVSGSSEKRERDKAYALAMVAEIAPKDSIEAMLATQMAAVHIAAMRESRLLAVRRRFNNSKPMNAHSTN